MRNLALIDCSLQFWTLYTRIINMNWSMIGHEWAVELLKAHVVQGETRHAYLLTGPQGVGRRTLALRLTQALNCPQPLEPGEPCRACSTCTRLERMQYPELAIVQSEAR